MDIGVAQITGVIASSSTGYLATYSPIFLLVAGLVLAMVVIEVLIDRLRSSKSEEVTDPGDVID